MNVLRDSKGRFMEYEVVKSDKDIKFKISEFEARVIGNRLAQVSELISENFGNEYRFDQDCDYWSRRFLNSASTRNKNDEDYYEQGIKRHTESNYNVKVEMTDFECWSLGNKLFGIGLKMEEEGQEKVAIETKWLGRRFHAEVKQE